MRVLLINPPIRLDDVPRNFPTGLGIIAAVVRKAGYSVAVMDINGHRWDKDAVSTMLKESDADVVGISGLVTTFAYQRDFLIPEIHVNVPGAVVIVGGGIGSSIPDIMLKSGADFVVRGEGEETIVELLNYLRDEKEEKGTTMDIGGVSYRYNGAIVHNQRRTPILDLDAVPFPAYDFFDMEGTYFKNTVVGPLGLRDHSIIASRGCTHRCEYCFDLFDHRYRIRSVGNVFGEINFLMGTYGVEHFSFQDDTMTVKKRWMNEFCDMYEKCEYDFRWSCTSRTDALDGPTFKRMRECGCTSVSFGIESGSQRILDSMNKKVKVEVAENALFDARSAGLRTPVSFIHGWPGETVDDMNATVHFCIRNKIPLQALMYATPFPGTKLYTKSKSLIVEKFGSEEAYLEKVGNCIDFLINLTGYSDEVLQQQRSKMIMTVLDAVPVPTPEEVDARNLELYGKVLYEKMNSIEVSDEFKKHRKEHGFNE